MAWDKLWHENNFGFYTYVHKWGLNEVLVTASAHPLNVGQIFCALSLHDNHLDSYKHANANLDDV